MLIDLIKQACAKPTFVLHGVRKIVQGVHFELKELPAAMDILKDLGYTPMKLTRLMNVYYNRDEVAKAKAKLLQRVGEEHSSASILTRNMEKTHPQTQGWCIQNIVISESYQKKERIVTADIFYRSTEAIMKFGADLSLIHAIFDEIGVKPSPVRFYFANLYVSAVFFPMLFMHTDGVAFLKYLRKVDPKFWWLASKAVSRYLDPVNRYTYRAQVKQRDLAQELDRGPLDVYFMTQCGAEMAEYHEPHMSKARKSTVRKKIK